MRSGSEPSEAYDEREEDMWRGARESKNEEVISKVSLKDITTAASTVQERMEDHSNMMTEKILETDEGRVGQSDGMPSEQRISNPC